MKASSDLYQTAPQFNFSVRLKPLGNLWSVNEVITSSPLSLHVLFFLPASDPEWSTPSIPLLFICLAFGFSNVSLIMSRSKRSASTSHFWQVPLSLALPQSVFFCTLEMGTIPLSSHYSANCDFPREKRVPSPGLHSITFHLSDSPLWITAETHCHFWSKVIQWDTIA